ncbi:hypothetical protein Bhyg_05789 [Pseudolycoriella hygida]|uniref:THAP-type domain-containing protein n=1 Tax=Pseudolycoriella hygida TaxID=35572 RepID=A0A9Q0N0C0_9DIPT|nr:hypothetical protein Bhyg_05789 [Pseudolycoriella hygida]
MSSCVYKNCKNYSGKNGGSDSTSFHWIPKEEHIRDVWLSRIDRSNDKENIKQECICSEHFQKHQLIRSSTRTFTARNPLPIQKWQWLS